MKKEKIEKESVQSCIIREFGQEDRLKAETQAKIVMGRNTHEINRLIVNTMLLAYVAIAILILTYMFHLFAFNLWIVSVILIFGTITTLSPKVLFSLEVEDEFLKYYTLIMCAIFIGLLGTNHSIGIYMTYALVPIISCFYCDRVFTRNMCVISYICMTLGVFMNSADRYEVQFMGWTHMRTFIAYQVGFSIEYFVIYIFLRQLVRRFSDFLTGQQETMVALESESERYRLLLQGTNDILLDYDYRKDEYHATASIYDPTQEKKDVIVSNFSQVIGKVGIVDSTFLVMLHQLAEGRIFEPTEFNLSRKTEKGYEACWIYLDGSVITDEEGKAVRFIGKIHDITKEKQAILLSERIKYVDPLTGVFLYPYFQEIIQSLPALERSGVIISVCVDNFREISDTYGYVYADNILCMVAESLRKVCREECVYCRIHGAHFIIYIKQADFRKGFHCKQKLMKTLSEIYVGEKEPRELKVSSVFQRITVEQVDAFLTNHDADREAGVRYRETGKHTMYEMLGMDDMSLTDADYTSLAAGQKFLSKEMELFRFSKDLSSSLHLVMSQIGKYFALGRIVMLSSDLQELTNEISYQWCLKTEYELDGFFQEMPEELMKKTMEAYDEFGYVECVQGKDFYDELEKVAGTEYVEKVFRRLQIGAQLWIPTMVDGEYSGAICFEKTNQKLFTTVEKYLLSDVCGMLNTFVSRLDADSANKAKSTFLSSMSHEIRTPMNAIMGMTEVALREDMSDSVRQKLLTIKSASDGLLGIINDILDFSKIESGKFEIVEDNYSLLSMINDVNVIMEARNKDKGLKLILDIPADLPTALTGDVVRVKQIIVNLVNNAIKYTEQGSVTLKINCDEPVNGKTNLQVWVKDTGMGIRKEDISKLFMSFSQVDTKKNHHKEGTGLGLAICKQLVDLMNGTISVESVYGEGSVFTFTVPQKIADITPAGRMEDYHNNSVLENSIMNFTAPDAKILIVDDNEINLEVEMEILKPLQLQMDTAENGQIAVNKVKDNQYDLILMDHFMPVKDGIEATREIRREEGNYFKNVPIIALSADAMQGVRDEFIQAGMNDFISKPVNIKDIINKLKKWLPADKIKEYAN